MKLTIDGPPEEGEERAPLGKRVLWFVALWVGGLVAVAVVSYSLRALIL